MTDPEKVKQLIENSHAFDQTFVGYKTSNLNVSENIGIDDNKRFLNVLNVGPIGFGKTQLMVHTALQDIYKGHGICIINPKGGLINQVIAKMPKKRHKDIIYINPAFDDPTPINVLEPYTTEEMTTGLKENQKEFIVSDLIALFRRQSENWGDRFGRTIETLLRSHIDLNIYQGEQNTLLDVFQAASNKEVLGRLVDRVQDPVLRESLVEIKEELTSRELEPAVRRLKDFVENKAIKRIINAGKSGIDFKEAVDNQKIILVDIQKGEIGHSVSHLVGSIVITKIWAAIQSRVTISEEKRKPFYLYIDEAHTFSGEGSNLQNILSECREYRMGCWLATQYLRQLDKEMRNAVTNNCRTKILFNPSGSEDISKITNMIQGTTKNQIQKLGKYKAIIQTPSEKQYKPSTIFNTYPPWKNNTTNSEINRIKEKATVKTERKQTTIEPSIGHTPNSGGEKHRKLLVKAKEHIEQNQDATVNLLYQDNGTKKPDGKIILKNGKIAHLEAENSTLTKPAKVLNNLLRAAEKDRKTYFVIKEGKASKLQNIVSDPKNRRGNQYEDEKGSYSHYKTENGEFTDFEKIEDARYTVIEVSEEETELYEEDVDIECPQLKFHERDELETGCIYRSEEGFCSEIEQECTLSY